MVSLGSVNESKASGADFFAADISIPTESTSSLPAGTVNDAVVMIVLNVATATAVKMTFNSTDYFPINNGNPLSANTWYFFEIPILATDTINLKQDTGTMNVICRIHID